MRVAHPSLERAGDLVHAADGLEHRRLLVELVLEIEVPAETRLDDTASKSSGSVSRPGCAPAAGRSS